MKTVEYAIDPNNPKYKIRNGTVYHGLEPANPPPSVVKFGSSNRFKSTNPILVGQQALNESVHNEKKTTELLNTITKNPAAEVMILPISSRNKSDSPSLRKDKLKVKLPSGLRGTVLEAKISVNNSNPRRPLLN